MGPPFVLRSELAPSLHSAPNLGTQRHDKQVFVVVWVNPLAPPFVLAAHRGG